MPPRRALLRGLVLLVVIAAASPVRAQQPPDPPGPFVLDARGALPRFKESGFIAGELGVPVVSLPTFGFGFDVGAHWYPLRARKVTLGVGASLLWARGRQTPTDEEGEPTGPTIETRLVAFAPQLSLNFGTARGWSYISGGIGQSVYDARLAETPTDNSRRASTINYGGGARWFARPHLAFSLDLRFYAVGPQAATDTVVATERTTLMVFSAGVAFK